MLRSKKLAHFPVQFKEIFSVYVGVIGHSADPCDISKRPILAF